jgi:hypothetical protein
MKRPSNFHSQAEHIYIVLCCNLLCIFNLLTSFVRQRNNINNCFCFITTLHVSTPLGHHQLLPLKQLFLLYCSVTFQITLLLIKFKRSSLRNKLQFLTIFLNFLYPSKCYVYIGCTNTFIRTYLKLKYELYPQK